MVDSLEGIRERNHTVFEGKFENVITLKHSCILLLHFLVQVGIVNDAEAILRFFRTLHYM